MTGSQQIPVPEQVECPNCGHYPCSVQRIDGPDDYVQVEAIVTCPACPDSTILYTANPIEMVVGDE